MESTPSRDNRDMNIDATLFSENLAEVRNWKAKVFAFLLFISTAVLAPKTTFAKIITKNYKTNSLVNTHIISISIYKRTCSVHECLFREWSRWGAMQIWWDQLGQTGNRNQKYYR